MLAHSLTLCSHTHSLAACLQTTGLSLVCGVYVCVSLGVYMCVSLGVCMCVSLGVYMCVSLGVYMCVSLGVYMCVSLGVYMCVSLGVYMCVSLGVYMCVSLALSSFLSVRVGELQLSWLFSGMGWLRSAGSIKLQVSFAEYRLFYRSLLQKRRIIFSILLTKATPYVVCKCVSVFSSSRSVCAHWQTLDFLWYVV